MMVPMALHPLELQATTMTGEIGALLGELALTAGDDHAIVDPRTRRAVTWSDVARCADLWRGAFASSGCFADGTLRVGLVTSSPTDFCREYLAALAAGVTIAPLDPDGSEAELLWSAASMGLTHIASGATAVVELRAARASRARRGRWLHPSNFGAVVCSTRGTSGPPKIVSFTDHQLLDAGERFARHFHLRSSDRGFITDNLHRPETQTAILATLLTGGAITVVGGFDRRSAWTEIDEAGATWLALVPATVRALTGAPGLTHEVCARIRFGTVSAASLALCEHSQFWQSTGIPLIETYTLTEAAGVVAANTLDLTKARPGFVGEPLGFDLRVVDDEGKVLASGETGEIQLRGPGLVHRYLPYGERAERPPIKALDDEGWLTTGDIGMLSGEGSLLLAGRATDRVEVLADRVEVLADRVEGLADRREGLAGRAERLSGRVALGGRFEVLADRVEGLSSRC